MATHTGELEVGSATGDGVLGVVVPAVRPLEGHVVVG